MARAPLRACGGAGLLETPPAAATPLRPQVPEKAKHYGISKVLPEPVDPAKDLVLQFDLKLTNGLSCGGACEWPCVGSGGTHALGMHACLHSRGVHWALSVLHGPVPLRPQQPGPSLPGQPRCPANAH